ncbi:MAG: hypothetical protein ABSH08_10540 [Tepidisphaeraceae bacterium]|jgi:hypothetical protein
MPLARYFPRWRPLLVQMVMWIVLGATVVVAAMLDHHLRLGQIVELSPPITDGPLSFSLPAGWKNWTRQAEGDGSAHVATDSAAGVTRTLIISRRRVPHPIPPAEFILRAESPPGNRGGGEFEGVNIDHWPGQSTHWMAERGPLDAGGELQFSRCCAVVLPDDEGIMIRLDKNAPFDAADQRVYRQILDHVRISTTRPTDGAPVQLAANVTVTIPTDLRVYPQSDPLRSERLAAAITDEGGWISAEFLPVAIPEHQPTPSLLAGLAAREQLDALNPALADVWIDAQEAAHEPNHWTLTPRDPANDAAAPRRIAHLIAGDGGWGVIVVLSAEPPAGTADLDHLWDELSANVHVGKSPSLVAALRAGAALVPSATPQAQVAPQAPADAWWTWTRGAVPIGFTHEFSDHDGKYLFRYTVRRNWNATATAVLQQWGTRGDSGPWASMKRADAQSNLDDPLLPLFEQTTNVSDWITTIVRDRGGSEAPSNLRFNPNAFVLSRYLPGLLARVNATPTAFWTDRFPAVEAELFPSPLLLLASRVDDRQGLRCVEAQVNGAGSLSRWYFQPNATLDHADFAGDLHLRPSSQAEVDAAFAGDRRLTIQPR